MPFRTVPVLAQYKKKTELICKPGSVAIETIADVHLSTTPVAMRL